MMMLLRLLLLLLIMMMMMMLLLLLRVRHLGFHVTHYCWRMRTVEVQLCHLLDNIHSLRRKLIYCEKCSKVWV